MSDVFVIVAPCAYKYILLYIQSVSVSTYSPGGMMILYGETDVALSFSFRNKVFSGAVISWPFFISRVRTLYPSTSPSSVSPSENPSFPPSPEVKSSCDDVSSDEASDILAGSASWISSSPEISAASASVELCVSSCTPACSGSCSSSSPEVPAVSESAVSCISSSRSACSFFSAVSSAADTSFSDAPASSTVPSVFPSKKISSSGSCAALSPGSCIPVFSAGSVSASGSASSSVHAAADAGTTLPSLSRTSGSGSRAGIFSSSSRSSCCSIAASCARIAFFGSSVCISALTVFSVEYASRISALLIFSSETALCAAAGNEASASPRSTARTPANIFFFIFIFHPSFCFSIILLLFPKSKGQKKKLLCRR